MLMDRKTPRLSDHQQLKVGTRLHSGFTGTGNGWRCHGQSSLMWAVTPCLLPWCRSSSTGADMGCLGGKTEEERLDEKSKREANKKIERQLQKERQAYKATHRLLLLGQIPVCLSLTHLSPMFPSQVVLSHPHLSVSHLSVCRCRRIR